MSGETLKRSQSEGYFRGAKKDKLESSANTIETRKKTVENIGPHYKTIAVIASSENAKKCAEFNKKFVEAGENLNFQYDLDHPDAIYIIHKNTQIAEKIAICYGADIIINIDKTEEVLEGLAKRTIKQVINQAEWKFAPLLKNTSPTFDCEITTPKEIKNNLKENKQSRSKKIADLFDNKEFENNNGLLILGGAGPAASAKFFSDLIEKREENDDNTIIHLSLSKCPGKFKYISGEGPSFIPYYENVMDFANQIGIKNVVTPCNTNHIVKNCDLNGKSPGWAEKFQGEVIDYRDTLTQELQRKKVKEVLILGTTSTTNVHKLYHKSLNGVNIKPLTVDDLGGNKITNAISAVKSGNKIQARDLIDEVIEKERTERKEPKLCVVLACTELPLVYTKEEMKSKNLICVSSTAIDYILGNIESSSKKPSKPTK